MEQNHAERYDGDASAPDPAKKTKSNIYGQRYQQAVEPDRSEYQDIRPRSSKEGYPHGAATENSNQQRNGEL